MKFILAVAGKCDRVMWKVDSLSVTSIAKSKAYTAADVWDSGSPIFGNKMLSLGFFNKLY